ncbi:cysteine hydrolase family protein [Amycolatopsis sp. NPDC088138]|uniref:cysteine hydrolase family protein n=1 Tax=Amycolatopsis sp. NPDC088138 TaxID=3363938 RepID=UPI003812B35D
MKTALVVVDLQNDFCTGPAVAARYRGRPGTLERVTANAGRAVDLARRAGTEVVFVRFLGDVEYQRPSWRRRDRVLGKAPKCLAGSWGAQFHGVAPAPGERVFTKYACFDAFFAHGFGQYLRRRRIGHLVFAGVYADVCVDSTARTAFQKGFHLTVLTDCTTALHRSDEETLRFMETVYGARTTTHDRPGSWTRCDGEESEWSPPEASKAASAGPR